MMEKLIKALKGSMDYDKVFWNGWRPWDCE